MQIGAPTSNTPQPKDDRFKCKYFFSRKISVRLFFFKLNEAVMADLTDELVNPINCLTGLF